MKYNINTHEYHCTECRTRKPAIFTQGVFAEPGSPAASFAEAIECPNCGHSISATIPARELARTPVHAPEYEERRAAAYRVWQALRAVEEWGRAFDAAEPTEVGQHYATINREAKASRIKGIARGFALTAISAALTYGAAVAMGLL